MMASITSKDRDYPCAAYVTLIDTRHEIVVDRNDIAQAAATMRGKVYPRDGNGMCGIVKYRKKGI
jgi:hypothetical protein